MAACLLVQPIHSSGVEILKGAGLEVRLAASTDMAVVGQQVRDCVAAITRNAGFSADAIEQGARLQVIGVHGIGVDPVAVSAATAAGVCVVNTPTANVQSVAEHAIALMFALARGIPQADRATRQGNFDFKYQTSLVELGGLTLGLVGFGNIGQATARLGAALGMQVVAFSPTRPDAVFSALGVARAPSLDDVLRRADILSLHLPLVPSTLGMIGARAQPDEKRCNTDQHESGRRSRRTLTD
jgi:D-3-phosphoglycerate dehydrogenase